MSKEKVKFCPYRKRVRRVASLVSAGKLSSEYFDDFKPCLKERCMGYKDGVCLKLSKPSEKEG